VDGRQELPFLTELIIFLSKAVINWGGYIFVALVVAVVIGGRLLRRDGIRDAFDLWLLQAPLIGGVIRAYNTTRFASTLCIVVGSGVPILLALETARTAVFNRAMRSSINDTISRVREGSTLARALRVQNRFPPVLLQLIESGEATGRLAEMLDRAAQSESDELERKTVLFTSLLEPLLILLMGGLVMMIVLAILMPVINLNQLIR
jgi:general secretion pathway protein F